MKKSFLFQNKNGWGKRRPVLRNQNNGGSILIFGLVGHEGERYNCFSINQLVGQTLPYFERKITFQSLYFDKMTDNR